MLLTLSFDAKKKNPKKLQQKKLKKIFFAVTTSFITFFSFKINFYFYDETFNVEDLNSSYPRNVHSFTYTLLLHFHFLFNRQRKNLGMIISVYH